MSTRAGAVAALTGVLAMVSGAGVVPFTAVAAGLAAAPAGDATTFVGDAILGDRSFRGFFVDTGDAITVKQPLGASPAATTSWDASPGALEVRTRPTR